MKHNLIRVGKSLQIWMGVRCQLVISHSASSIKQAEAANLIGAASKKFSKMRIIHRGRA
ncbi:hypothetical protein ROA7745_03830 [Roseovarius aestuarii]|uniref:Uncharacterized protein n=1 Tax=Roseovarius aestuarii TaxID=475083 RepID=A0A1X7BWF1_9RHOB|nr:hypothetical protein ROA7745_03830 [Roseovarius aestuarii]